MKKHLDARDKGEMAYDYREDILFFKIKDRYYQESLDLDDDIILDIDKEGYITGIQLFGASKLFNLDKITLKNIKKWEFFTKVKDNIITIKFMFEATKRNKKIVESRQNIVRETDAHIQNSEALCKISA